MRRFLLILAALAFTSCSGSSATPAPSSVPTPAPVPAPAPVPQVPWPPADPRFSQNFWNAFVHDGFEQPTALVPLQRLTAAPQLYLRVVDDAGVQIDPVTLSTVEQAMRDIAATWGGGQFGLAGVTRGTETHDGQPGWLTVHFLSTNTSFCGQSDVGRDGGMMELNYQRGAGTACACNGSNVSPRVAKHELGHAFGYWHTASTDDLMKATVAACDGTASANEQYHATVAYQTPVGTTTALPASAAAPRVIVD